MNNRHQAQSRLRQVRQQLEHGREQRAHARLRQDQFLEKLTADGRSAADLTGDERATAEGINRSLEAAHASIEAATREQAGLLKVLGEDAPDPDPRGHGNGPTDLAFAGGGGLSRDQLLELASYAPRLNDHIEKAYEIAPPAKVGGLLRSGFQATAGLSEADTAGGQRNARYPGILPELRRPTRILDLVPTAPWPTEPSKSFTYWKRAGGSLASGGIGAAREQVENPSGMKASGEVYFSPEDVDAATVAVWTKAAKQDLEDVPAMSQVIQELLQYDLRLRLEAEILAGNGSGANIRGILHTTGIGAAPGLSEDNVADALLNASTDVTLSNGVPTAAVVNPRTIRDTLKVKGDDGHYLFPNLQSLTEHSGVDSVVQSVLIDEDNPLVGDFPLGAVLFIRSGLRVLVSDSDQDDFTRNRVTILVEGRFALSVFYPEVFVELDMTLS